MFTLSLASSIRDSAVGYPLETMSPTKFTKWLLDSLWAFVKSPTKRWWEKATARPKVGG